MSSISARMISDRTPPRAWMSSSGRASTRCRYRKTACFAKGSATATALLSAPGRTNRDQITQYRPVGNWGLQFSSVGAVVYRRAKEQGLGRRLPAEWFLQDIKN